MSSFFKQSASGGVDDSQLQQAFIARGRRSASDARCNDLYPSAEAVIERREQMLASAKAKAVKAAASPF